MKILHIKGATDLMGLNQNEYLTVPLVRGSEIVTTQEGTEAHVPNMTAAFKPTPQELESLNKGASIHLSILGSSWPPMKLLVQQPPADPSNPDDFEFEDPKGEMGNDALAPGQFVPQMRNGHVQIIDVGVPCLFQQGDIVLTLAGQPVERLSQFLTQIETYIAQGIHGVQVEFVRGTGKDMRVHNERLSLIVEQ
jgi:hypothetical protein